MSNDPKAGRDPSAKRKKPNRRRAGLVTTHEEYLAALPEDQRAALEKLRRTIRGVP